MNYLIKLFPNNNILEVVKGGPLSIFISLSDEKTIEQRVKKS